MPPEEELLPPATDDDGAGVDVAPPDELPMVEELLPELEPPAEEEERVPMEDPAAELPVETDEVAPEDEEEEDDDDDAVDPVSSVVSGRGQAAVDNTATNKPARPIRLCPMCPSLVDAGDPSLPRGAASQADTSPRGWRRA